MEAIKKQFILPVAPIAKPSLPVVYPWEQTNLFQLCQQLYTLAAQTGFTGTFDDFKMHFGAYLENDEITIDYDIYSGQYNVSPLPSVEQILRTKGQILTEDIVIAPIPYYEVSNEAGGITVSIG